MQWYPAQVIFHMQTCDAPVLPPLHQLFEDSCAAVASRPIHEGKSISWDKLEVIMCTQLVHSFRCYCASLENRYGLPALDFSPKSCAIFMSGWGLTSASMCHFATSFIAQASTDTLPQPIVPT